MEAFLALIIGLLIGLIAGIFISSITVNNVFDGEYDRAKYEWKLNKEKEKQNASQKN